MTAIILTKVDDVVEVVLMVAVVTVLIETLSSNKLCNIYAQIWQFLRATPGQAMHFVQEVDVLKGTLHHASILQTSVCLSSQE